MSDKEEPASAELVEKVKIVFSLLEQAGSVLVAYSGGVDSSLLAFYARAALGENAKVVIADSASLALEDLEAARAQAMLFEWNLVEISTDEFENEDYLRNDEMRCFHCKATLFKDLHQLAQEMGIANIAYGANLDDDADYRPGQLAAQQFGVLAPLQEAGLSKAEIRLLARRVGLPSWDRPQNACLSSRIPTSIPVTITNVSQIEAAEGYIKSLGFKVVRVRYHQEKAVVEIGQDELKRLQLEPYLVNKIETTLLDLGFTEVIIDPRGYRQGGANNRQHTHAPSNPILSESVR